MVLFLNILNLEKKGIQRINMDIHSASRLIQSIYRRWIRHMNRKRTLWTQRTKETLFYVARLQRFAQRCRLRPLCARLRGNVEKAVKVDVAHDAAVTIQALVHGHLTRRRLSRECASVVIQCAQRRKVARQIVEARRALRWDSLVGRSGRIITAAAKVYLRRKHRKREVERRLLEESVVIIQMAWRSWQAFTFVDSLRRDYHRHQIECIAFENSSILQRAWRCFQARTQVNERRTARFHVRATCEHREESAAATMLQCFLRDQTYVRRKRVQYRDRMERRTCGGLCYSTDMADDTNTHRRSPDHATRHPCLACEAHAPQSHVAASCPAP